MKTDKMIEQIMSYLVPDSRIEIGKIAEGFQARISVGKWQNIPDTPGCYCIASAKGFTLKSALESLLFAVQHDYKVDFERYTKSLQVEAAEEIADCA